MFKALLVFNSVMGVAYVLSGLTIWRELAAGKKAAGIVFILNCLVLVGIVLVYLTGGGVAVDSLYAMTFRTAIWLGLFLGLVWLTRRT
ncbi:MAG: hypothetical protein ACI9W4_001773 [Rhodothermales bacterium]